MQAPVGQSAGNVPLPKRKLSPLRRACLSLGLKVDARPETNLAGQLRRAKLGKTAIEYLEFSDDEQAVRIVALYHSLSLTERKAVTIDYLIMAVGADVHRISGVIQESVSRVTGWEHSLLISSNSPAVVRAVFERALTPQGHSDRVLFFKMAGMLQASGRGKG